MDTRRPVWRVRTGGWFRLVRAADAEAAIVSALRMDEPKTLGQLISAARLRDGTDRAQAVFYAASVHALRKAGFEVDPAA